jgi:hypothetical protein
MESRCDNLKITGSGYCLKHWINQRYALIIVVGASSGYFVGSKNWILGATLGGITAFSYWKISKSVEDLQDYIKEHSSTDVTNTNREAE